MNVGLEKIERYVGYRLKDVNENIERGEALNKPVNFEMEKLLIGEKAKRKELEGLAKFIDEIKLDKMWG